MIKRYRFFLIIGLALALWGLFHRPLSQPISADTPTLALQIDDPTLPANSVFDVTIAIQGGTDVAGFEFDLLYDNNRLDLLGYDLTNTLGQTTGCDPLTGRCAIPLGPLPQAANLGAAAGLGGYSYGQGDGVSGDAAVATLHLAGRGVTGQTTLRVLNARLADVAGVGSQPQGEDLTLTLITPSAVALRQSQTSARSTTWWLAALALLTLVLVITMAALRRAGRGTGLWLALLTPALFGLGLTGSSQAQTDPTQDKPTSEIRIYLTPNLSLPDSAELPRLPQNGVGVNPDVDNDTLVTVVDIQLVAADFGLTSADPEWNPILDMNQDNVIDETDLSLAAGLWKLGLLRPRPDPTPGETGVAVTRETILHFDRPINPATITPAALYAQFGSQNLAADLHVAPDGRRATLFYQNPLPPNARVRVTLIGDAITDSLGYAIDPDDDGRAGGTFTFDFDTVNLTTLPGTIVCGRVFASELAPGQGGGSVNTPLEGATISVDGAEDSMIAVTDNMGDFCLDPAPVGRFFVHIDGRTAVNNVPPDAYYPYVGKAWQSIAGQTVNVGDAYLPLIAPGSLQPVSQTAETVITFPPEVIAEHPELEGVNISVPADSLYADDGTRGGQVGIAPVPPDRLPGRLPEGLDFPLVITVQTDGPTNFDTPAPICFPNLPDPNTGETQQPGEKSALWSFNHDDGKWHVVGPMTVSADGTLVCSDPGFGILAPGWHGDDPDSEGDFGDGGGGDPDCDPEQEECDTPPPCPSPDDFRKYQYACSFGTGLGVAGCFTFNQGVEDLCGNIVSEHLCDQIVEGADDCAEKTAQLGKACQDRLDQCIDDFTSGRSILAIPDAPMSVLTDTVVAPYGTWPTDLLDELNELVLTSQSIMTDTIQQVALQDQIKAVLNGATSDEELTPEQWAAFLPLLEQFNNLTGGHGPQEFYNPRSDRVGQLVESIEAQLHLLDTPPGWYVLENVDNGLVQRGRTESNGALRGVFLSPDTHYILYRLVPQGSGFNFPQNQGGFGLTRSEFYSPPAGFRLEVRRGGWTYDPSSDADGDGLTALEEYVVGTSDNAADSDTDGVTDPTELLQGSDPLENVPAQTGLVGSVDTPGTAVDVCAFNDIVVVADSSAGITVFNAFDPFNPVIIAQVNTPGAASRVACAAGLGRVAVADGSSGLAIVNITDPPAAFIAHQTPLGGTAQAVAVEANLAYVGLSSGLIKVVDLETGDVLGSVAVAGAVKDIQIGRHYVYALSATQLHVVSHFNQGLLRLYSTASPYIVPENRRLFAGENLLYTVHPRGYNTFDISDPLHPGLIAAGNTAQFGWLQLVDNGSGLGVAAVGLNLNPDDTGDVRLYDVSDPTQTNEFLTTYATPGSARALALYDGLAYAADGSRGLQVISYLAFDSQGQPPTVSLSTNFPVGVVEEGQVLQLNASVTDDVQVGRVEFYVNGEKVNADGNYPFAFSQIAPNTQPTLTVQARALDTGGNAAWSEMLTLAVVPDATPPLVTQFTPQGGNAVNTTSAVSAFFNEPMSAANLNATTFQLREAGLDGQFGTGDDVAVAADSFIYLDNNTAASLAFNTPLPIGRYQATLLGSVSDLAGNSLGSDFAWEFSIRAAIYWTNPAGGGWSSGSNWSSGSAPSGEDVVVIDLPGAYTISVQGTQAAGTLTISNPDAILKVQSTSAGNTTLTVANDLINAGNVQIETTGSGVNRPTTIEVTQGRFINHGALEFRTGSNLNSRILRASVFNDGVITVNYNASLDKAGAELVNEGAINIVAGESLTLSGAGHAFYQNSGALSGGGFTSTSGGVFYFMGGAVTGLTPLISSGQLEFGPSAAGPASFRLAGTGALRGDIPADVEVWINGGAGLGAANITALQSFTNYGVIRIETSGSGQNVPSSLTLNTGQLTNQGVINSNAGSNLHTRDLNASVDNWGVINVNYNLNMGLAGAAVTNHGAIVIAAGETLSLSNTTPTFTLDGGAISGDGVFKLTQGIFNFLGGDISGGDRRLFSSALNFGSGALGIGTLRLAGLNGALSGDIPSGVTIWVNGGDLSDTAATVSAETGFTNRGVIRIETSGAGQNLASTLTVNNGTLVNIGVINSNAGSSNLNTRNLNASLDNQGTVNVNYNLTMAKTDAVITNTGTINLASGETLAISGGAPTVNLVSGALAGNGLFRLTAGTLNFTQQSADQTAPRLINSALYFAPGAAGSGTWRMGGTSGRLGGDIPTGVTVWINGGDLNNSAATVVAENGFTNRGAIRIETSGAGQNLASTLTVNNGVLVNAGVIDSNAGSSNLNTRNLNASLDNQGTVNVNYNLIMAKTDAVVTNTGTINLASGETLSISGGAPTVNLVSGAMAGSGIFKLSGGVVNFTQQTADQTAPRLINSALYFAPGASGSGTWRLGGTNGHLGGDIPAGVTVWVNGGDLNNSAATVVAEAGLTNYGALRIETSGSGQNQASTLTVNNGALVNLGVINSNAGSNLNTRNLNASLDNQGTVNVNYNLAMAQASAVISNTGTINLASGENLTISGAPVLRLLAGDLVGPGNIRVTGAIIQFSDQEAINTAPQLINSRLTFAPGASGSGTWRMGGTDGQLGGDIPAGVTVWVNGGDLNNSAATVVAEDGFTNYGVIRIETSGSGQNHASTLSVNNGTLVNLGIIDSNTGSNLNARNLNAALDNQGVVNVNYSLTLNKAGASYVNNGVLVIAGGKTGRFMGGGTFSNGAAGSIQGAGTLRVDEVTPSNDGVVNPGTSPGILSITGSWPQTAASVLNIEIGGTGVGSGYDRLAVSGVAGLDGVLNLSLINGFEPALGATFQIMTFGSRTGTFATVNGLEIGNGKQFQVIYNATNVTLQVVAAP